MFLFNYQPMLYIHINISKIKNNILIKIYINDCIYSNHNRYRL
jgi:hypothetical protein